MATETNPERVPVSALGLRDVIALPETDLKRPARVTLISEVSPHESGDPGVRFIELEDAETGEPHGSTLVLGAHRLVDRYEVGLIPPYEVGHGSIF